VAIDVTLRPRLSTITAVGSGKRYGDGRYGSGSTREPLAPFSYHHIDVDIIVGEIEVVSDEMAAVLRTKTGAERLAIASGLYRSARRMLVNHLHAAHPDWDDLQVEREASHRLSHGAV
jgi:hypothetical protein